MPDPVGGTGGDTGQGRDGSVLTPNWIEVPIRWRGVLSNGTAATGYLEVAPYSANRWGDNTAGSPVGIIGTRRVIPIIAEAIDNEDEHGNVVIVDTGVADFTLPNTDFMGGGWGWHIVERFNDKKAIGGDYIIEVPESYKDEGIDISKVVPIQPPPGLPVSLVSREEMDELEALVEALRKRVFGSPGGGPITLTKTFEEGAAGSPIGLGLNIDTIIGSPVYKTTNGPTTKHGSLSMHVGGGPGTGGYIGIENLSIAGSRWQIYIRVNTVGADDVAIVDYRNSTKGKCGSIHLRSARSIGVYDIDQKVMDSTQQKFTVGQWFRIDTGTLWNGPFRQQSLDVAMFTNAESKSATDVVSQVAEDADMPDRVFIGIGTASNDWDIDITTIQATTDTTGTMAPYDPSLENQVHLFDRPAGQAIVGQDDLIAVTGATYATTGMMHGTACMVCASTQSFAYSQQNQVLEWRSVYFKIDTKGGSAADIVRFYHGAAAVAGIRARTAGAVDISNGADGGTPAGLTSLLWTVGAYSRLDYLIDTVSVPGSTVVTARLFTTPEGTTYGETTNTFAGLSPIDKVEYRAGTGWAAHFDTERTFPTATGWADVGPYQPTAQATYRNARPGVATTTTADVASCWTGGATTVNLAWSTLADGSGNPTGTITYVAGTIDADGCAKHHVTGLTAGQRYFAKFSTAPGVFVGDPIQLHTLPPAAGAFSGLKWMYWSCQGNQSGDASPFVNGKMVGGNPVQLAWKDAIAFNAALGFGLGDYGYWGGAYESNPTAPYTDHLDKYNRQTDGLDSMRKCLALMQNLNESDDHENSGNNGDSNNSPAVLGNNIAMEKFFAMWPTADPHSGSPTDPRRANYGSFMLTDRIQVIYLDCYSADRAPGAMPDTRDPVTGVAQKSFLGGPQDAWLRTTLRKAGVALNIVLSPKAFLGDALISDPAVPGHIDIGKTDKQGKYVYRKEFDKIWNYGYWRDDLLDWLDGTLTLDGKPISLTVLSGDRHSNAYVSAANNPLTKTRAVKFSCWIGSGMSQHGNGSQAGEDYDLHYGFEMANKPVMQYIRGTLSDDGAGHITLFGESREVHDTWDPNATNPEDGTKGYYTNPAGWSIGAGWLVGGTPQTVTETYTYGEGFAQQVILGGAIIVDDS